MTLQSECGERNSGRLAEGVRRWGWGWGWGAQMHTQALTCDIDGPGVLQFGIQSVQVRVGKAQADQSEDQHGKHFLSPKVEV